VSRRRSLAAVVLCCPLVLTACIDAVPDAQQSRSYADGVEGTSGDIRVLNALVVTGENADSGVVSMTIVNRGSRPEQLVAIESNIGTVELSGTQRIAPNRSLSIGAGDGATAIVRGTEAEPGEAVTLTLRFRNADSIRLRTVVVPANGEYETITPSPSPTPSESLPSPAASPTES
jgi:copper(I)-binding protein